MATVTPFFRDPKRTDEVNIRFRLVVSNKIQFWHKSEFSVVPIKFDMNRFEIKEKILFPNEERKQINKSVKDRRELILEIYDQYPDKENFNSEVLNIEIDKRLHPENHINETIKNSFFDLFDEFLDKHPLSEVRKTNYKVIKRALQRFELYQQKKVKGFQITLDSVTADTLHKLDKFLRSEHTLCDKHPDIYEAVPESRKPQPRGDNTMSGFYSKVKAFYKWCIKEELTTNNPFLKFEIKGENYGTPYYLTIEERNQLYNFDLSHRPQLAIQRDIFIFQCLVGCRVGDLFNMKKSNVNNNVLSYIARKTKDKKPVTVQVPLTSTASEILARYEAMTIDNNLLPFISEQKYNDAIKKAFEKAGINRIVTILNPTTGEQEQRPLNEIASSHLARRTFCGNLYKKVKDPNLIGSMSGHVNGSKAFARYREIDEQDKIDVLKLIE
jgi:integrase